MGKIIPVMITMLALTLALQIFSCSTWNESGQCTGNDASSLMNFLSNPSIANSGDIWGIFFGNTFGLLAVAGFTSLIIAGFYFNRNESYIYIAMAVGLVSSVYPAITLWSRIRESSIISDPIASGVIATIVASTVILTVMVTIVDWSRGHD